VPVPISPAAVTAIDPAAKYVFTELDQTCAKVSLGTVTPDPTDSCSLRTITITSAGGVDGRVGAGWHRCRSARDPRQLYRQTYSRNQANVELEEPFVSPDPLVIATMPAGCDYAPVFEIQEQLGEASMAA
jgi:hypothetical protein